jgi:ubiquinone/menaquinone biosynthesis C-methylase UbiE
MNTEKVNSVHSYYARLESRLGYSRILGGTKHFGYYPENKPALSENEAILLMEDLITSSLSPHPGYVILDAGCGEGRTACRIASKTGCYINGITVVPHEVASAEKYAKKTNTHNHTDFRLMDFTDTSFKDASFDGIYMLESIVHAYKLYQTVYEMHRLLKPNCKIAIFTYTIPTDAQIFSILNEHQAEAFKDALSFTIHKSAMHALPDLAEGKLEHIMRQVGFRSVSTQDLTQNVAPSIKRLYQLARPIYPVIKTLHLRNQFVNITIAAELFSWAIKYPSLLKYHLITAKK